MEILDTFATGSRRAYNSAVCALKKRPDLSWMDLRDQIVTNFTKSTAPEVVTQTKKLRQFQAMLHREKSASNKLNIIQNITLCKKELKKIKSSIAFQKNTFVTEKDLLTPKDVRSSAVKRAYDALKSGFSNLKAGNIDHFSLHYKCKNDRQQTFRLSPKNVSMKDGCVYMTPSFCKEKGVSPHFQISVRNVSRWGHLNIDKETDVVKTGNAYYVHIIQDLGTPPYVMSAAPVKVCGIDPGVRTLATAYSHSLKTGMSTIIEYQHGSKKLLSLNKKSKHMKKHKPAKFRNGKKRRGCIRKRTLRKLEKRKADLVDQMHWCLVNSILKNHDVVCFGDIRTHTMVKGKKNHRLNSDLNDLKMYQLKQRLIYKGFVLGKRVVLVQENHTTMTCSSCGVLNRNVGASKVFMCGSCGLCTGRDWNASKNMLLKSMKYR
jgi:putative transposase